MSSISFILIIIIMVTCSIVFLFSIATKYIFDRFFMEEQILNTFYTILVSSIVIVISAVSILLQKFKFEWKAWQRSVTINKESDERSLKIIYRSDWYAKSPKTGVDQLKLPAQRVIIAHTSGPTARQEVGCIHRMCQIQLYHMKTMGWSDIGYNFVIGGDGKVYEGRGWMNQGAHTKNHNAGSICIAFLGNYNNLKPSMCQLATAKLLIADGVKRKYLAENYRIYGHHQLRDIDSPGRNLFEVIKTWEHWSSQVK